jgi:sugar O-acyltransferase (sialic acid O-acetyltransferase NeuD family)
LQASGWHVAATYDDDPAKHGQQILGVPICGPIAEIDPQRATNAIIALGDGALRRSLASHFQFNWITVVHPAAWVDPSVRLGPGTVVCAGAVIQPECRIGQHAIVNTQAGVDHDCRIGNFAHIGPGAQLAGGVNVGAESLIGAGATIIPRICVGARTTVGAGATVVEDLPDNVVAVGCPARAIKQVAPSASVVAALEQVV